MVPITSAISREHIINSVGVIAFENVVIFSTTIFAAVTNGLAISWGGDWTDCCCCCCCCCCGKGCVWGIGGKRRFFCVSVNLVVATSTEFAALFNASLCKARMAIADLAGANCVVGVWIGVTVAFLVAVDVGVGVGVGVGFSVGISVGVGVGFGVGIGVGFSFGVGVGFSVGVEVGVGVGFSVGIAIGVGCSVGVGTGFRVGVEVRVGVVFDIKSSTS